jgi:1,4-alpha-glucan branching enzyme
MSRLHGRCIVSFALLVVASLGRVAFSQPRPMAVVSPEVRADRTIVFRLLAPNAKQVSVHGEFSHEPIPMTKDAEGIWSATVGPVEPNVYGYGFTLDGLNMPDPCNTFVRVGSLAFESQVEVPGEAASFPRSATSPTARSTSIGTTRKT